MEPKSLSDLPFWFQLVSGAGLFFGTFGLAAKGWFKGALEPKEAKPDAVVLSASLADGQQFASLTKAVEALLEFLKDREEDADRHNNRLFHAIKDTTESNERICEAVERQTKIFKERTIL